MDGTEQPTAPYLEAVGAYAFRGPGRFHVPDHEGGPRAEEVVARISQPGATARISCESIASYPPGAPALRPGEHISAETVDYLRELTGSGARLHGASDPTFQTIHVFAQEASP